MDAQNCVRRFRDAGHDHVDLHSLTDDGASWVMVVRKMCPASDDAFEAAWETRPQDRPTGMIMGRMTPFPRRTRAFGKDYSFSGQTAQSLPVDDMPDLCKSYRTTLAAILDTAPNGSLLNWYNAIEGDYIGQHADDERSLCKDRPIFSATWCKPDAHFRRFRLVPKTVGQTLTLDVQNGDVIVMGGTCQATHKHEVMKPRKRVRDESLGRRINQTDRYFSSASPALG